MNTSLFTLVKIFQTEIKKIDCKEEIVHFGG